MKPNYEPKEAMWEGKIPYCSNCKHDALEYWGSKLVTDCGAKGRYCRSNYCPTCGSKMKNSEWESKNENGI